MATLPAFTPTKAVFYFRTLDRWPGGNADMITIKATLPLTPDAAPGIEAEFYRCFDGRHTWFPARRVVLDDPGDALAAFLEVTRSLAARGEQTLVIRPLDVSDDEWDCAWAESEILLHANDDGPETPDRALLRLVRKPSRSGEEAPDPEVERAFALGQRLTGVGRVFQFANTEDALSAAYRAQGGAAEQRLGHVGDVNPTYLPPDTDAAFVEFQAGATRARDAEQAARATRRDRMLVYRLDEVPEYLTRGLAPDASPRRCLFFTVRPGSPLVAAMFAAVPEAEHADTEAALDIANRVTRVASMSVDFARALRPDEVPAGGSICGGTYENGFHGGDADEVERWFDAQGIERASLRTFLAQLVLLRVVDEDGAPVDHIDTRIGGGPVRTEDSQGDGLYVFERDHRHVDFKIALAFDGDPEDARWSWLALRSSDLPPGVLHTVTVPAAPAAKQAKTATKKAAAKKAGAKKTAAKKAPAKTAGAKTAAKKTEAKTAAKTGAKKTAKKNGAKKTGAKTAAKKAPAKKTAAKKIGSKKITAKKTPAKKSASR